jgi:hypothetical protein
MHAASMLLMIVMSSYVGSQPFRFLWIGLDRRTGHGYASDVTNREIVLRSTVFVGSIVGLWLLWNPVVEGMDSLLPDWANSITLVLLMTVTIGLGGAVGLFGTMHGQELQKMLREWARNVA